jgi:hypothetical protein
MKWGVRRFQNKDGTRTEAGKLRYRNGEETNERLERAKAIIKSVGNSTGKAAKTATNKLVKAIKKRHPSLMTDEELITYRNRLQLEKSVKDARRELHKNDFGDRTWSAIQDIARKGATKLVENTAQKSAEKLAERLLESKETRKTRKYQEKFALEKAKNSWEKYNNKDDEKTEKDKSNEDSDKKTEKDKSNEDSDKKTEDKKLTATETLDKLNRDREKARLEANRQEAERKAKEIEDLHKRQAERKARLEKEREEEEKRKKKKKEIDDYWDDYKNNPGGYWSAI